MKDVLILYKTTCVLPYNWDNYSGVEDKLYNQGPIVICFSDYNKAHEAFVNAVSDIIEDIRKYLKENAPHALEVFEDDLKTRSPFSENPESIYKGVARCVLWKYQSAPNCISWQSYLVSGNEIDEYSFPQIMPGVYLKKVNIANEAPKKQKYWKCIKHGEQFVKKEAQGYKHELYGMTFYSNDEILTDKSKLTEERTGILLDYSNLPNTVELFKKRTHKYGNVTDLPISTQE